MNLITVFLFALCLSAGAKGFSQTVSLSEKNVPLEKVFTEIKKQTGYTFVYTRSLLKKSKNVTIHVQNAPIEKTLDLCFKEQPLTYTILNTMVIIKEKQFTAPAGEYMVYTPPPIGIHGRVVNQRGEPLSNVSVLIVGTNIGTATDSDGRFTLTAPDNKNIVLEISSVGYQTKQVNVGKLTQVEVSLDLDIAGLSDVVVVGYGKVKKIDLTGSVGSVDVKSMNKAPVSSFSEALSGRIAGLQVGSVDGQPGQEMNIQIRGVSSLTQSVTPLFVVDGFPIENFNPSTLNPEDIESVSILKDASSTAIYGSRGSNGVILINTKEGKIGKPVVNFSSTAGVQTKPNTIKMMNPYEFLTFYNEYTPDNRFLNSYLTDGKTIEDYRNVKGIDWVDKIFRVGLFQQYNASVSGGTNETKYIISGNAFDQTGALINTGMSRYSGRFNISQKISKKFNIGLTTLYTRTNINGQQARTFLSGPQANVNTTALMRAQAYRPILPNPSVDFESQLFDLDLNTSSTNYFNPLIDQRNQHLNNVSDLLSVNGFIDYSITKYLSIRSNIGIRQNKSERQAFYNSQTARGNPLNSNNPNGVWGSWGFSRYQSFFNETILNYKKTFLKKHTINALALFGVNSLKSFNTGYDGTNLLNESKGMDGLDESAKGSFSDPLINNTANSLASFGGRIDYNYASKYLLTLNFRADGSSKFVKDKWGYFPSGAIAWNMSKEDFFKELFPGVSYSKLRVSYGATGNNRVGDFAALPQLVTSSSGGNGYSANNQIPVAGAFLATLGNLDLRWEKTVQLDIGYEIELLKSRIVLEVDYYNKKTTDLLLTARLPQSSGFLTAPQNIGSLRNTGVEVTIKAVNISSPVFNWTSNFNIAFNKNKILGLAFDQDNLTSRGWYLSQFGDPAYMSQIGQAAGMMIGYVWDGVYQFEEFNNPSPGVYVLKPSVAGNGDTRSRIQPGDIKIKDLNGDGALTLADMAIIGRGQPVHTGGFNNDFSYKNFSLNLFFQWSYGNNIFNANRLSFEGNSNTWPLYNQYEYYFIERWTPENPSNTQFRPGGQGKVGYFTSKVVEDGSYLRLKTLSLAYSLPKRLVKKWDMKDLAVSLSAQNLLTFTNYSGMDPEVSSLNNVLQPGWDFSTYPNTRTIVLGLKVTF